MQTLKPFECLKHRGVSFHKRVAVRYEPETYWLTVSMPWKSRLYDIVTDEFVRRHRRVCIGFRFFSY